jgi:hypothetical protein
MRCGIDGQPVYVTDLAGQIRDRTTREMLRFFEPSTPSEIYMIASHYH